MFHPQMIPSSWWSSFLALAIYAKERICVINTFPFNYFIRSFVSPTGTVVPITSLAQYTTAPTFRSGYILNSDSVLQRPSNMGTPPTSLAGGEATYLAGHQYQQQQQPSQLSIQTTSGSVLTPATATLRRMKQQTTPGVGATASPPHLLQQSSMISGSISTYDGIAPRTLSTGMAVNSQFYYE